MAKKKKEPEVKTLLSEERAEYDRVAYRKLEMDRDLKLLELRIEKAKEQKTVRELEAHIFGLQKLLKLRDIEDVNRSHVEFNNKVKERLNIEGDRFGFNPLTGEVIE